MNSHGVRYLLVGGYAVGYHGFPRTTGDMDVWVAVDEENARKLVAVFHEFGMTSPEVALSLFLEHGKVVRMGVPPLRLEVITGVSGVDFDECYSRRIDGAIDGEVVRLISLSDLKANKLAAGRPKDINDLENLP